MRRFVLPSLVSGFLAALLPPALLAQDLSFKVIVNAENPVPELRREQVALLFLNRGANWAHGPKGAPVDQSMTSPVRAAFSNQVLGQSLLAVSSHWHKRMLEREMPPPVKASDDDVIAHVAKNAGGVGYVSTAAVLPPTVNELRVRDVIR